MKSVTTRMTKMTKNANFWTKKLIKMTKKFGRWSPKSQNDKTNNCLDPHLTAGFFVI